MAADQFSHLRPDLKVVEFEIPDDLSRDNIKTNLREWYKLKRSLAGLPADIPDGFDNMVEARHQIHLRVLETIHERMTRAADPNAPSSSLARMAEGACQQRQCPGMMAYALLSLK